MATKIKCQTRGTDVHLRRANVHHNPGARYEWHFYSPLVAV